MVTDAAEAANDQEKLEIGDLSGIEVDGPERLCKAQRLCLDLIGGFL
jgi:hypothetical protein